MKPLKLLTCVVLLVAAGCESKRAPRFVTSEQTEGLVRAAQKAIVRELEAGFGTPTQLIAWTELPIDFGNFTGTVSKVAEDDVFVDLAPESPLGSKTRLTSLNGAAVVSASAEAASAVLRVAAYNPESKQLTTVDENGKAASLAAKEGDTVQIVGDGLQFGRDLYLRHCLHCHGVSGDGNGPTAKYFAVKPRDYRKGVFKFTSTKTIVRASRDDLYRIIKLGVPGTYMPSFMLLPDHEVKALAEYVRWLAMRGEMENKLGVAMKLDYSKDALGQGTKESELEKQFATFEKEELPGVVETAATELKEDWEAPEAEEAVVMPTVARVEPNKESIDRGRQLFRGEKAKCYSCHGEAARGNGASTEEINDLPGQPGVKADKPGLFDVWGNIAKPRDLTGGIYRGGRRPIDIYRRISAGIKGTPMQAFGTTLKDEEIWDLTNYVLNLPFEAKSKSEGHDRKLTSK